jgi:hypothetical protein
VVECKSYLPGTPSWFTESGCDLGVATGPVDAAGAITMNAAR